MKCITKRPTQGRDRNGGGGGTPVGVIRLKADEISVAQFPAPSITLLATPGDDRYRYSMSRHAR